MIKPISLTERLLFTTVRIEAVLADNKIAIGTGFFFDAKIDEKRKMPLIVSNKHVVHEALRGRFQLHQAETTGDEIWPSAHSFTVEIDKFAERWIGYPDDMVDLCAMPFQPLREQAQQQGKSIFNLTFDESVIIPQQKLEELSAVENILMIGYPIGLWDEKNNLPLIRRGITATHIAIDFGGRPEFLIDSACFPGSSGSPVVLADEGAYQDKRGNVYVGRNRIALLGVLYAGPQVAVEGSIVPRPIPTTVSPISETRIPIHLGYVIKATSILALCYYIIKIAKKKGLL